MRALALIAAVLATGLTLGSGAPGGVFAPCLVLGALVGAAFHRAAAAILPGDVALGTTCFLARDAKDDLAGGVSTTGWAYKYPGRLGDSPIIGHGLYVEPGVGAVATQSFTNVDLGPLALERLRRSEPAPIALRELGYDDIVLTGGKE